MFPAARLWVMIVGSALTAASVTALAPAQVDSPSPPRESVQGTWRVYASEATVAVTYGAPDRDDVVLSLACDRSSGDVTIHPYLPVERASRGSQGVITLASAGGVAVVHGRAIYSVRHRAFVIEGRTRSDALVPLLGSGGTLDLAVPGARETIPLSRTAGEAAKRLEELCPVRSDRTSDLEIS